MTSKIATVTITTTLIDPPVGIDVGGFSYTMKLAGTQVGDAVVQPDEKTAATFNITTPGVYTFECARIATTGEAIAPPAVSDPITVASDQVLVPLAVQVSLLDGLPVPATVAVT